MLARKSAPVPARATTLLLVIRRIAIIWISIIIIAYATEHLQVMKFPVLITTISFVIVYI